MGTQKGRKHFGEAILEEVLKLRGEGKTHREISEIFGFEGKRVIKSLLTRYYRKRRSIETGIVPKAKGRPRKTRPSDVENINTEIRRLKMENDLLRSFLSEIGRR